MKRLTPILFLFLLTESCNSKKVEENFNCLEFNLIQPTITICSKWITSVEGNDTFRIFGPNPSGWYLRINNNDSILLQILEFTERDSSILDLFRKNQNDYEFPGFPSRFTNQRIVVKNGAMDSSLSFAYSVIETAKKDSIYFDFYSINNRYDKNMIQTWIREDSWSNYVGHSEWCSNQGVYRMTKDKIGNSINGLLFVFEFTKINKDSIIMTTNKHIFKLQN